MSRSSRSLFSSTASGLALLTALAGSPTATAQAVLTAEDVVTTAQSAYGPPPPKPKCSAQPSDEIVVCAEEQEQSQFRLRDDARVKDDYARETMNEGNPQAPDVAGPGIFRGKATFGGCVKGLTCPPPRAIDVDFAALPEAPAGSDADRIAQGLPPLGDAAPQADQRPPQPTGQEPMVQPQ